MLGDSRKTALAVALLAGTASAIELNPHDEQSIKDAAATAAFNTWSSYTGNQTGQTPGFIRNYWAEGGLLFDTMIQYWYYTGDTSNNAAILQGMNWQSGEDSDFFPSNYSSYLANDDQSVWALAAMTAAELNFPQQAPKTPWITMAENVFNEQIQRWDTKSCGGGLRWQIYPYQSGYTLKNSISNGQLFELSARLARYTNNQTYSDWAEKIWDWSAKTLMDTSDWMVYDSAQSIDNCKTRSGLQWSFNYAPFIRGGVYMYNLTNGTTQKWETGLQGLLTRSTKLFFPEKYGGNIQSEVACEPAKLCNTYQIAFKASFPQALASVALLAPQTTSKVLPLLQGSAVAAAKACTGGDNGTECGSAWYKNKYDGSTGLAQDLSATSLFTANLVAFEKRAPGTQANATVAPTGSGSGTSTTATGTSGAAATTTTGVNAGSVLGAGFAAVFGAVVAAMVALV